MLADPTQLANLNLAFIMQTGLLILKGHITATKLKHIWHTCLLILLSWLLSIFHHANRVANPQGHIAATKLIFSNTGAFFLEVAQFPATSRQMSTELSFFLEVAQFPATSRQMSTEVSLEIYLYKRLYF